MGLNVYEFFIQNNHPKAKQSVQRGLMQTIFSKFNAKEFGSLYLMVSTVKEEMLGILLTAVT